MALPIPDDNRVYKECEYWNQRFSKEEEYDWLGKYADVRELLGSVLKKSDRILLIGCGNSTLSADLYDDGYENLVNIDYSSVVIESMRARHSETRPKMQWLCMNMLDMSFDAHAFDVVLDKAAMDALCVDEEDVWDPKESCRREVHQLCRGIHRVLTPDGLFIQISFAQPHFRRRYLDRPDHYGWKFEVQTFGSGFGYFFFTMRKDGRQLGADEPLKSARSESASKVSAAPIAPAPVTDDDGNGGQFGIDIE